MNNAMSGLLEPYGELIRELGYFQTKVSIEKMVKAFREVLELSIRDKKKLFNGQYADTAMQDAIDKSKLLLKNHYFKQVEASSPEGTQRVWTSLFKPALGKALRNEIFNQIIQEMGRFKQNEVHRQSNSGDLHWFDWVQRDSKLQPLMQKYRELE